MHDEQSPPSFAGFDEESLYKLRSGLAYWGLASSLDVVKDLLTQVDSWRLDSGAVCAQPSIESEYDELYWADEVHLHPFKLAAWAQVVVASICPMFESLIQNAASKFKLVWANRVLPSHRRSETPKDFWDPSKYCEGKGKCRADFLMGFGQLLEALELSKKVSPYSLKVLGGLFRFRNRSLHLGYFWPRGIADNFRRTVEDMFMEDWFTFWMPEEGPVFVFVNNTLVLAGLKQMETLGEELREMERDLCYRLKAI